MLCVAALCLVFLTPVWSSSHCDDWESFYSGDNKIDWEVQINTDSPTQDYFSPSGLEADLDSGSNDVLISTVTWPNQLKVLSVSLEVKRVKSITYGSDVTNIPPNERNRFTQRTINIDDNVNSILLELEGQNNAATLRNILIIGCYDAPAVFINNGLNQFKARWESGENVEDFIGDFYTANACFYEPGQPKRTGPADIAQYIFRPVQLVRPTVDIIVLQAVVASESRIYTIHEAIFYNGMDIPDPERRYAILWKRESFDGGFKVDKVVVNYEVEPTSLINDISG